MKLRVTTDLPRQAVPSGCFVVGGRRNLVLEAYLGTCVGVALWDRHANVGGLIHLLLPDPPESNSDWRPQVYAATGLPLFIKALLQVGASREHLAAIIAGGALVLPLSRADLALDIGGRTAERVEGILHQEGIPVHQSETGGFFSCKLSLNLQTWESRIEPVQKHRVADASEPVARPDPRELDSIIEHIQPIPQVALKILRMIDAGNHDLQDLAREIRQDQVISAKTLRLSNAASISMQKSIDRIDRALVVLGEKRLLQWVVSASLQDFFQQSRQGYSLCKGGLFKHALGTAMVSAELADFTGAAPSDVAYTAGLLHDIGKVVLDQFVDAAHPLFYRKTQIESENLISVEQNLLGLTHTEAGARLAKNWELPATLKEVIRFHHQPERACADQHLVRLVYLADLLMSRFMVGQELERLNGANLEQTLLEVGLPLHEFPNFLGRLSALVFELPLFHQLESICPKNEDGC